MRMKRSNTRRRRAQGVKKSWANAQEVYMKLMRALVIFLAAVLMVLAFSLPVLADGQYGGGTTTTSEQPKAEVTHATVAAGLGDNLVVLGLIAGSAGLILTVISRVTRRVYFLD